MKCLLLSQLRRTPATDVVISILRTHLNVFREPYLKKSQSKSISYSFSLTMFRSLFISFTFYGSDNLSTFTYLDNRVV